MKLRVEYSVTTDNAMIPNVLPWAPTFEDCEDSEVMGGRVMGQVRTLISAAKAAAAAPDDPKAQARLRTAVTKVTKAENALIKFVSKPAQAQKKPKGKPQKTRDKKSGTPRVRYYINSYDDVFPLVSGVTRELEMPSSAVMRTFAKVLRRLLNAKDLAEIRIASAQLRLVEAAAIRSVQAKAKKNGTFQGCR